MKKEQHLIFKLTYSMVEGWRIIHSSSARTSYHPVFKETVFKETQTTVIIMDGDGSSGTIKKVSKSLPEGAVATLKVWMLSPEHITHPYPTPHDQAVLMQKTGIDKEQLRNWFTNARRRIWKPMLKKQLEEGKLATVAGVGVVTIPPDGAAAAAAVAATAAALAQPPHPPVTPAARPTGGEPLCGMPLAGGNVHVMPQQQYHLQPAYHYGGQWPQGSGQGQQYGQPGMMTHSNLAFGSHAVLMELFARDQELVRQAAEGARLAIMARAALMGGTGGGGGGIGPGVIAIGGGQNGVADGSG